MGWGEEDGTGSCGGQYELSLRSAPRATGRVINSGLTFREGHDRTNSLQNPKLPDWAIVNLNQLPDNLSPGKIEAAGFFNESWEIE